MAGGVLVSVGPRAALLLVHHRIRDDSPGATHGRRLVFLVRVKDGSYRGYKRHTAKVANRPS
jgi:hypothetical protein